MVKNKEDCWVDYNFSISIRSLILNVKKMKIVFIRPNAPHWQLPFKQYPRSK